MTTIEHLNKIKAKCEQLLAIAEKRTPGPWHTHEMSSIYVGNGSPASLWELVHSTEKLNNLTQASQKRLRQNATFIASCAGSAEAGWRSTIAAIDGLEEMDDTTHLYQFITTHILSAWPEELLN